MARPAVTAAGWDISTASYLQGFSLAAQGLTEQGMFFKPDGTKMYVADSSGDVVVEYNLSTAWDISTISYLQRLSISAQERTPTGVFFKPDGTKMYVVGRTGDDVNEYNLSTAWDISTTSYVQNFSVSAQDPSPNDVFFKPDGLKMYVVGSTAQSVYEYDLSSAWDISTTSYLQSFSVSDQDLSPQSMFFKPDGRKMYVTDSVGDDITQYNLSTAWDISTTSYVQDLSVSAQESFPSGVSFKPDGLKMYVIGAISASVHEYDL